MYNQLNSLKSTPPPSLLNKYSMLFTIIIMPILLSPYGKALALDATSFDPLPVTIKAQSGGVPVGTVIAWPLSSNPPDGNWLECNGQAVNAALYPELNAMMTSVPDYQGYFLRGRGGNSAALGVAQGDAIRNITGSFNGSQLIDYGNTLDNTTVYAEGAFYYGSPWSRLTSPSNGDAAQSGFSFDASRVVPTANENRPVNKAVKYLIRAKP